MSSTVGYFVQKLSSNYFYRGRSVGTVFWKLEIRHRLRLVYCGILPSHLEAVQSTSQICFPGGARRVARVLALLLRSVGAEFTLPICRYSILEMRKPFSQVRRAGKGEQL